MCSAQMQFGCLGLGYGSSEYGRQSNLLLAMALQGRHHGVLFLDEAEKDCIVPPSPILRVVGYSILCSPGAPELHHAQAVLIGCSGQPANRHRPQTVLALLEMRHMKAPRARGPRKWSFCNLKLRMSIAKSHAPASAVSPTSQLLSRLTQNV